MSKGVKIYYFFFLLSTPSRFNFNTFILKRNKNINIVSMFFDLSRSEIFKALYNVKKGGPTYWTSKFFSKISSSTIFLWYILNTSKKMNNI
jgi:hypothetical protein